jgi:hypothetical protein
MDTEAANRSVKDGTMAKSIQSTVEQLQPEAAYFTSFDGHRTAYMVFDLPEPADIPRVAEPFFQGMNAKIDISPVMNVDDVQQGLTRMPQS